MKICLIRPPKGKYDDLYTRSSVFHPMGLGYIASNLIKNGFEVQIIDAFLEDIQYDVICSRINEYNPDVVGISFATENRFPAIKTAKELKKVKSSFYIFAGGPHPSLASEDLLLNVPAFDLVVSGEGEQTFAKICKKIQSGAEFSSLPGLSYRKDGKIIHNQPSELIKELDRLPFPARHLFANVKMKKDITLTENFDYFSGETIITSRGCPYNCNFCATSKLWGEVYRSRSPHNILTEIEHVIAKYKKDKFWFFDDVFTLNKKRVMKFCHLLIDRNVRIEWVTQTRLTSLDVDLLKLMKRVGLKQVLFGIESGSDNILKQVVKKKLTVNEVRKSAQDFASEGIKARGTFIFSHPNETFDEAKKSIELMKEIQPSINSRAGIMKIYPGTEIEKIALKNKILPEEFTWTAHYKNTFPQFKIFSGEVPLFFDKMSFWQIAKLLAAYASIQNETPNFSIMSILKNIDSWMEFKYLLLLSVAKTLQNLHLLK
jgi:anaerobic magnesium-protoporphyrin IX monomethyl ester cyclase